MKLLIVLMFACFNLFAATGYIADGIAKWDAATDAESGIAAYRIYYIANTTDAKVDTKTTPYVEVGSNVLSYNIKSLPITGNIIFCIAARDGGWNVSDCQEQPYFLDNAKPSTPVFKGITYYGQS